MGNECALDKDTVRLAHPAPPAAGRLVASRYSLVRPLAEGGFGAVWEAQDTRLNGHPVALKFLPWALGDSTEARSELLREARILLSLSHPRLVRFHTLDAEGGEPFLVMELVRGPTLSQLLVVRGRLSPEEVREIAVQVCEGLECVHGEGVIHLDLKPSNLMLAAGVDGPAVALNLSGIRVKIMDFGISRLSVESGGGDAQPPLAATLAYASPEQIAGGPVDARSDLYSLGCVIYHLLAGEPPFRDQSRSMPSPIPGCPEALWCVVRRCLEPLPSRRFSSAAELARALTGGEKIPRHRRGAMVALALLSGLAIFFAVAMPWNRSPRGDDTVPSSWAPFEHTRFHQIHAGWKKSLHGKEKVRGGMMPLLALPASAEIRVAETTEGPQRTAEAAEAPRRPRQAASAADESGPSPPAGIRPRVRAESPSRSPSSPAQTEHRQAESSQRSTSQSQAQRALDRFRQRVRAAIDGAEEALDRRRERGRRD